MKKTLPLILLLVVLLTLLCGSNAKDIKIGNRFFPADSEEIDLSDMTMEDTVMVEEALSSFTNLKKVIMCRCGLDNETMDALNRKYEDIRFVWEVSFGPYEKPGPYVIRTDATVFAPVTQDMAIWGEYIDELEQMRYLTDLEIIDLGHMGVKEISWVQYMPNLTHLIIIESYVTDLSPLASCKNLKYLELWKMWLVEDLSPLVECTALEDLNISNMRVDATPILQMTWLKRLWANNNAGAAAVLRGKMPDSCQTCFDGLSPTDKGWWKAQNYYDMRDAMGMEYLPWEY